LQTKTPRKVIAEIVGVSQSTISRELKRNSTDKGHYLPDKAHEKALERRARSTSNRALDPILVWRIKEMIINDQWSPKQISGVLGREGVNVSYQTIYNIIYADTTGELAKNTRHKLKHRKRPKSRHMPIANRTSIHQRPKEADGKRFGDWEMDLIVDPQSKAILTMTERSTNMLIMSKLPCGKQAEPLAKTVVRLLYPYKDTIKTITTDNGPEFAAHEYITRKLGVKVYFADPYSSWQKGAIENANKLIRQYIPKGASFDQFSDNKIMSIQKKINLRPREKLNFSTPKVEFFKHIS
jgi:IS30 family transposase